MPALPTRIKFEKGLDGNGHPQVDDDGKAQYEQTKGCLLSALLPKGLRLEPFDDGAPPPTLSAVPPSDTHLLSSTDFSRLDVLVARAKAVVSPAAAYFETAMEGKRGGQLQRMKAARIFNPLHVLSVGMVTEHDIDALSLFRFSKHPLVGPRIEAGCSSLEPPQTPQLLIALA